MADRSAPIVVTPHACPFVALESDRDRRLDTPDPLHRCFAEPNPRARSMTHQADFCLSSMFAACPIFLDWASRAAAEPVGPHIPTAAVPVGPALHGPGAGLTPAALTVSTAMPVPGSDADAVPSVPVTRSVPVTPSVPVAPAWTAPPPWMRRATPDPWLAEAVLPPDAFADFATAGQPAASFADGARPVATMPIAMHAGTDVADTFAEETTGMPPATVGRSTLAPQDAVHWAPEGPLDAETAAELAASRYRTDLLVAADVDDGDGVPHASDHPDGEGGGGPRPRPRVPIDANAATSVGPQARPSTRATGSREWEGPRRFEAYAATQRRRPGALLVGGGALVLTAVIVAVFLVPGLFLGGAPGPTATPPVPTALAAAARPGHVGAHPTPSPRPKPERTPRIYRVKSGDTLIKIGRRFDVSIGVLQCINRIRNPNNVVVGSTLTIPTRAYRCPKETRKP